MPAKMLAGYMIPMFGQSWSVFAPEPINGDYRFEVRALVDGEETERVSATDVERVQLQATRQNVIPFEDRHDPGDEEEPIQCSPTGWRGPVTNEGQSGESWLLDSKRSQYGLAVTRILFGLTGVGLLLTNFGTRLCAFGTGSAWNGETH